MTDTQDATRRAIVQLVEDLTSGSRDAAGSRCAPEARWWLPLDGADDLPAVRACDRLAGLLASADSVEVAALIVAPEGGRAVVELSVTPSGASQPTTATSVLRMDGGLVLEGATYLDVAAWAGSLA